MGVAGNIWRHARADVEATRGVGGTPDLKLIFDSLEHNQGINTISTTRLSASYEDMVDHTAGPETNQLVLSGKVDFNQMALWGLLFFNGAATGTGAGANKAWDFTPVQTSDNLKSLYVQLGMTDALSAGQPGVGIPYVVGEQFTLNFTKTPDDQGITFGATLRSPKVATDITAYTGSAPEPTLQLASNIQAQIYVDASGGTIGTTADNYFTGLTFEINNNWVDLFTFNNTAAAQDSVRPNPRTWTATATRYFADNNERARYKDKAERKLRMRVNGASLGSGTYQMDLDLYGVWESRAWQDSDGLWTEQLVMRRKYNSTAGTSVDLNVVNALASL